MALASRFTTAVAGAALAAASLSMSAPLHAADMIYRGAVVDAGLCSEAGVLNRVTRNFRHQVTHVPNLPQVDILDYRDIRLTRYEPLAEDSPIERTYCQATAMMSDGHNRQVWYLVEGGQGFASIGDNVEFCVAGFDRWYVYNSPWCRVLR
ncbi:MAG: hypothetical protein K5872_09630 [Rhizobiaceae bacterium]|nr:hypothetical protein [Rhizobiaceae bacterium]MCV0406475.1 hypothetical protein [Rhizobiaceae bacterium]